jgi:Gamma interferon inducible lysosomal thiol reductase (GILT)
MRSISSTICVLWILLPAWGCTDKPQKSKPRATETLEPGAETMGTDFSSPARTAAQRTVKMIVLGDRRCTSRRCRTKRTEQQLKHLAKGLTVERLDWGSAKAKKLYDRVGLSHLPAFLFAGPVSDSMRGRRLARFLKPTPKGKMRMLKVRADFDPRAEICDNQKDDTGNDQVDCADASCKEAVVCRVEIPKQLTLFVMSQCPYGTRALDAMSELLRAFDKRIDFRIYFIAQIKGSGFKSLHGQPEVDENIRELCAMAHYPKRYKYMDYIWCRNRKIKDKNWKGCTGAKTGIDAAVIERCASGTEGKELLRKSLALAQKLKISASPTWIANNRHLFHGIVPESIKQKLCKHNKGLAGCEKRLSTKSPVPDGVCN